MGGIGCRVGRSGSGRANGSSESFMSCREAFIPVGSIRRCVGNMKRKTREHTVLVWIGSVPNPKRLVQNALQIIPSQQCVPSTPPKGWEGFIELGEKGTKSVAINSHDPASSRESERRALNLFPSGCRSLFASLPATKERTESSGVVAGFSISREEMKKTTF